VFVTPLDVLLLLAPIHLEVPIILLVLLEIGAVGKSV